MLAKGILRGVNTVKFSSLCFHAGIAGLVGAALIGGVSVLIEQPAYLSKFAIGSGAVGVLGLAWCILGSLFESSDEERRKPMERERT